MGTNDASILSRINQRFKNIRSRSPKLKSKSAEAQTSAVKTAGSISTLEPGISNSSTLTPPPSEPRTGENGSQKADSDGKSTSSSPSSKEDSAKDLWREAFETLSPEEQKQLSSLIKPEETDTNSATTSDSTTDGFHPSREGAGMLIKYIGKREEEWEARRWKFNIRGHEFVPRECINKIISCLTLVGNVGIKFAPEPASLVWPLVKGLMEVFLA